MKEKANIEQQVAALTQEQQQKMYKGGLICTIVQTIIMVPWIIGCLLGLFVIFDPPAGFDYMKVATGYIAWGVIGFLVSMAPLVILKITCPYYSDAKWKYIKNLRKNK